MTCLIPPPREVSRCESKEVETWLYEEWTEIVSQMDATVKSYLDNTCLSSIRTPCG